MRIMRKIAAVIAAVLLPSFLTVPALADSVTDTIGIYVGYYGFSEDEYLEKATYHWTELDDAYGGNLDTHTVIYSYYSGSRTYLVAARGFPRNPVRTWSDCVRLAHASSRGSLMPPSCHGWASRLT